jgi:hypothetical protein
VPPLGRDSAPARESNAANLGAAALSSARRARGSACRGCIGRRPIAKRGSRDGMGAHEPGTAPAPHPRARLGNAAATGTGLPTASRSYSCNTPADPDAYAFARRPGRLVRRRPSGGLRRDKTQASSPGSQCRSRLAAEQATRGIAVQGTDRPQADCDRPASTWLERV